MKKHKLSAELEFNFILIGILCQHKDYRLCFEINRVMDMHLMKLEDLEVLLGKKKDKIAFPHFSYKTADGDLFNLFSNRSGQHNLVPEFRQLDYFLQIYNDSVTVDEVGVIQNLKSIPIVSGAYSIKVNTLRSRENFVF